MKKISLILVLCLLVLFVACDNTGDPIKTSTPTEGPTAEATVQATKAPTPEPTEKPEPTPKGDHTGGIASENPLVALLYDRANEDSSKREPYFMTDAPIAIQFYATTSFDGLNILCHSLSDSIGTIEFTLYEWLYTYDESLKHDSVASQSFENYDDNSNLKMVLEEALPDGEYLLVLTTPDPSEGVGVWYSNDEPYPGQQVYFDDMYYDTTSVIFFKIYYTNTPNNVYGPLSEAL